MDRYFFHTRTNTRMTDESGLEMEGHEHARTEAIRTCGEMMRDAPQQFWGSRPWSVIVTNAEGMVLYEIIMDGVTLAEPGHTND